jgi:hypothetical protein
VGHVRLMNISLLAKWRWEENNLWKEVIRVSMGKKWTRMLIWVLIVFHGLRQIVARIFVL